MPADNNQKRRRAMILYSIIALAAIFVIQAFVSNGTIGGNKVEEASYNEFLTMIDDKQVDKVDYNTTSGIITFTADDESGNTTTYTTDAWPNDAELVNRLEASGADFTADIPAQTNTGLLFLMSFLMPIALLFFIGWWINRRMVKRMNDSDGPSIDFNKKSGGFGGFGGLGNNNMSASGAKIVGQDQTGLTFEDVAGQPEAKEMLKEIVDFLERPQRYEEIGAKLPRGALLVGPPGTGKTLLAKAVAGEANVPFFSISGSEFVEMFVGRGAAKVRDLFKQAAEKAPCIVFIDEIDTIGKKRDSGFSSNDEREQTLNQLLTEMDGFDNAKGIVVLGATNRPEILDQALLRPGRFDRRVPVELPDLKGRTDILKLHAKPIKVSGSLDYELIARSTSGTSGADLANIINEAALRAVRMGRKTVIQEDLQESVEVVIAGQLKKNTILSEQEKKIVAYHEIGHALVAAKQSNTAPVTKITITPRTSGALGYTMQVDNEEKLLMTREEAKQRLAILCGGRAAEEIIFDSYTTGASNDIEQATKLARNMITRFGMSDDFGMVALGQVNSPYLNSDTSLTCSDGTAQKVDEQVIKMISNAHDEAHQILRENRFKLHELAAYLIRKETITGDEFMAILEAGPKNPISTNASK